MKYSLAIAALVVFGLATSAMAEDGRVSQAQLADFGLSGMSTMSDAEASDVRGSFAFAASVSGSGVPGAFNISPAVAFGNNEALAVSASQSSVNASGFVIGVFPPFFGTFGFNATAGSAGFAYAASN